MLNNFICGIKDIVSPQSTKPSNRHSLYDKLPENSSESSYSSVIKRSLTPDIVNQSNGKMSAGKFPSSISSPNLAKQDSGSSSTSSSRHHHDLINFNEDYGRVIEEHERRLEERRMSGSRASSGSSGNGEVRTPKSKKRTLQLPNAPNREIKPSTILRLEDRDLVVIDKHDIKEAVSNESQVIIVDPPALPATPNDGEHVDLGDLLGGEWPELAGSVSTILNTDKKSGSTSGTATNGWKTTERNKSLNIASHLSNSKPRRYENGVDSGTYKKSEYRDNISLRKS